MRATLLVPTWDAPGTLGGAVRSGLRQTVTDIEVLIVGDGVTPDNRAVIETLLAEDERVRFLDLPKDAGRGEPHRDAGVRAAASDAIVYLCDDDLLLPRHVEVVLGGLADHDLVQTSNGHVDATDTYRPWLADLADPDWIAWHLTDPPRNRTSMTGTAHRRAAYLELPEGWAAPPSGSWADLTLWRQFFRAGARAATLPVPTTIQFPASLHRHRAADEVQASFDRWEEFSRRTDAHERLVAIAHAAAARQALEVDREREAAAARLAEARERYAARTDELMTAAARIDELRALLERKNERIERLIGQRKAARRRAERAETEVEELRVREARSLRGRTRRLFGPPTPGQPRRQSSDESS